MLAGDPLLGGLIELATHVEWMNGVQFYLKEDVPIIHGHVIYMDSPWALTSVSQAQFWPEFRLSDYGNGQVRGLSRSMCPIGRFRVSCTASRRWNARGEIKAEVWEQIKRSLNQDKIVLSDDMLVEWNLDEDIQYEEGRATNAEPLLVNHVNTWNLRPNAYTAIPNLFLASDYVRTNTDLATMESANEAARRAVNCILSAPAPMRPPAKYGTCMTTRFCRLGVPMIEPASTKACPGTGK